MEHSEDTTVESAAPPQVVTDTSNGGENLSHRDRVAKEILSSERTYVENMLTLIEVPHTQVEIVSKNSITPSTGILGSTEDEWRNKRCHINHYIFQHRRDSTR